MMVSLQQRRRKLPFGRSSADISFQVAGNLVREIEVARTSAMKDWLGVEIFDIMTRGGKFFNDLGGYTLPKARS
jgi:hypothetical protein